MYLQTQPSQGTVQVVYCSFLNAIFYFRVFDIFQFPLRKIAVRPSVIKLGLGYFSFLSSGLSLKVKTQFSNKHPFDEKKMFLCSSHYYFEVSSVVQALNSKHITSCHQKLFQMHQGISIRRPLHSKTFLSTIH